MAYSHCGGFSITDPLSQLDRGCIGVKGMNVEGMVVADIDT